MTRIANAARKEAITAGALHQLSPTVRSLHSSGRGSRPAGSGDPRIVRTEEVQDAARYCPASWRPYNRWDGIFWIRPAIRPTSRSTDCFWNRRSWVVAFKASMNAMQSTINQQGAQVTSLQNTVTQLQSQVTQQGTQITALQQAIQAIKTAQQQPVPSPRTTGSAPRIPGSTASSFGSFTPIPKPGSTPIGGF